LIALRDADIQRHDNWIARLDARTPCLRKPIVPRDV